MARWYRDRGQEPVGMVDEWVPDTGDLAGEAANRVDLDRAFTSLGPPDHDDRRLAEAYYREDRPVKEVAERFGIPAGTVKSRLFRIRRRLAAALEREPGS
jgi:RNA polymerase sigma factor (sigma-70 family)